ncbi:hypothetical protein KIN20_018191 [Parelaphostrongylus tenuis]|uniref:Uncharacterized protein n=1 Tax=Parelaphostrongylus tenuis TaxID=148309 RepID=A0AAD5MX71_PARTN|nr:hypothetical protein KIN20_014318 [Parelaphostrongylus tenuis]KAJ1359448.1 hypothetical protein KIN20_018191 [Parelaphostrongylus tenuis]
MPQCFAVSADEETGNELDANMDKNVRSSESLKDDDDRTNGARRALLNVYTAVEQANIYGSQRNVDWESITMEEAKTFMVLVCRVHMIKIKQSASPSIELTPETPQSEIKIESEADQHPIQSSIVSRALDVHGPEDATLRAHCQTQLLTSSRASVDTVCPYS